VTCEEGMRGAWTGEVRVEWGLGRQTERALCRLHCVGRIARLVSDRLQTPMKKEMSWA